MREVLGCDPNDVTATCMGFTGSCSDLALQPNVVAALPDGGYVCTAFPADDSARDTFLSGLIGFAVSWPVAIVIANCFGVSTSTDDAQVRCGARFACCQSVRFAVCGALC